jgi:hypothetical protein
MSLANLKTDASIANEVDSVGSGFGPVESGLYNHTIKMAYLGVSAGGANKVTVHLADDSGKEIRQEFWVTSGTAKGGKNYYEDKDGNRKYLPGFEMANSLCLLTVGDELFTVAEAAEPKLIKLWNSTAKAEVPTEVPVLVTLLGKKIVSGVIRQIVDKNVKNDAGEYVPSGETRMENEVDKFFRDGTRLTTAEIRAGLTEATFADTWAKKWTGVDRNKASKDAKPAAANSAGKPSGSIFKKAG